MSAEPNHEPCPAGAGDDLFFLLMQTARHFRQAAEKAVEDNRFGLTPAAIRTLGNVIRYQGEGLGTLAERMDVEAMSLHRQVERLEKAGLVERHDNPNDRRMKPIYPTEKAMAVILDLDPTFDRLYKSMTQGIPKAEMDRIAAILEKMRANLTDDPDITAPFSLLPSQPTSTADAPAEKSYAQAPTQASRKTASPRRPPKEQEVQT